MKILHIIMVLLAGIGNKALAWSSKPADTDHSNKIKLNSNMENINQIISSSIANGGVRIDRQDSIDVLNPELVEIIRQIGLEKNYFSNPVLIFDKGMIIINDEKMLEEILSSGAQTVTSLDGL